MKSQDEQILNEIIDELRLFFSHSIEEDIKQIADMYYKKKLLLHNVSQQRELLVAYEKHYYTASEWILASEQCEKEIDEFLATNCG